MINGETPNANIENTICRSNFIYRFSKGNEACLENKNPNTQIALQAWDMTVARAAPFTPMSNQKIKIGSSTMFMNAPIKTEHIATAGRPCVLIKAFNPVDISTKIVPNR